MCDSAETDTAPKPVLLRRGDIELRLVSAADEADLAAVSRSEFFEHYSRSSDVIVPGDTVSAAHYVQEALAGWAAGTYLPFVVRRVSNGELLGATRFGSIDHESHSCEIGWTWYVEHARGSEVNPTCKWLMLGHAFDELAMERVQLKTGHRNVASQRAIAKLGATHEGVLRHAAIHQDGSWRDTHVYSILRAEWPALRDGLERRLNSVD